MTSVLQPTPVPVLVEVLAYIPTDFFHCLHCERLFDAAGIGASMHQEIQTSYPPEMLEEAEQLAAWLYDLSVRYGDQLHIQVIDPQSLQGFLKSLRHWVRRYPTFIINHRTKYTGWEPAVLERLLEERIVRRAERA
ncbi:MAG: hypothetical protein ACE5OS_11990 [Anaerolineae bacterium]